MATLIPLSRRAHTLVGTLFLLWTPAFCDAAPAPLVATNTYGISTEDLANPERGFYLHTETLASAPSPVPANLANLRVNGSRDPNGAYVARISLVLRVFYLDTFAHAPLSSNQLQSIQADLASIRSQGAKAIVRFAYYQRPDRPFPEPGKAQILEHIRQLAPVLRRNRDVIAVLQHGFIGAWGEGYYTDVFSTAGQAFTAQNWRDRAEVLQALLDALPSERMIQVRVPQQRQKFLQGPAAPTTTPPSAEPAAFGGSAAARVGFHNDCFLADDTDAGTFSDFEGATDAVVIARLRGYQAQESRFTVMGGETCVENGPADNCAASGGRADSDLELFHFSFLNQSYNANVNDDWVGQGCLDPIRQRLGYRLELVLSALPRQAQPGQVLPVTLAIRNTGFASPYNPRGAELILRSTNSAGRYFAELSRDHDARRWFPGTTQTLSATLALPADMPPGDYEALLHLPDPAPSLYGLVPYTIRLANADILTSDGTNLGPLWEPATGYHRLGHTLAIRGPAQAAGGSAAEVPVLPYSAIRETYDTWRARHFPGSTAAGDPAADPDADGWQNLFEYAVGTDPTAPSASPVVASWEEGRLVLTIPKGPGVKDVEYQLEGSAGLSPTAWSAAPVTVLTDDPRQVRARLDETGAHGFLRVRVTLRSP